MNILIALLAVITFLSAIPFLFFDLAKIARGVALKSKELSDLKAAKEEALLKKDYTKARDLELEIEKKETDSVSTSIVGLLGCCFGVIGQFGISFFELVIIIAALITHIGIPLFGFIALGIWALMIFISIITAIQSQKAQKEANAVGNTYLPPSTNPILKIIGFLPDLYALYVFLVIIGLL